MTLSEISEVIENYTHSKKYTELGILLEKIDNLDYKNQINSVFLQLSPKDNNYNYHIEQTINLVNDLLNTTLNITKEVFEKRISIIRKSVQSALMSS